jgi:hypothetical protein
MNLYKEVIAEDGTVTIEKTDDYKVFDNRWKLLDRIGNTKVSTVFLVLDHSFDYGEPILYETMIFGSELDQEQFRYNTRAEAIIGHNEQVNRVKALTND